MKITIKYEIINNNNSSNINMIIFYKYNETNESYSMIPIHIINNPYPTLQLDCYAFDIDTPFYEYIINYIIDNKIGKYKNIEMIQNVQYHTIIAHFDIININILLV